VAAQHANSHRHRLRRARRRADRRSTHCNRRMTLRISQLAKHYGDVPVFENVTLTVEPGEFVAIGGESGGGKSTLLNCMAGLDSWDAGTVTHEGTDIGALDGEACALWRRSH